MNQDLGEMLKNRILIDYERAKTFKKGTMPNPRFAIIYISNFCIQNCRYCEYVQENKGGFLPTKHIFKIIDQFKDLGVSAIELSGGGEPLIHPEIVKILRYCQKKNIVVGVISNFAVRNDELLKTIVDTCSYIRITIDSFDPDKYNEIRRPKTKDSSLPRVKSNLKRLVELKKKNNSSISIGIKMVINRLNYKEIEKFVKEAANLKVDNVQFKKVYLRPEFKIKDNEINNIKKQLIRLKEKYKDKIDIFFGFYDLKLDCRCFMSINHIFIDGYGDMYLCCHYLNRKKDVKLGSTFDKKIKDIWFSKRHWEAMKNTKIRECNEVDCRWIRYTNLMRPFVEDDKRSLDFV